MAKKSDFDEPAALLEALLPEMPETISLEDLQRHPGLMRLVLAADDLANRVDYRALDWAKSQ